MPRQSGLLSRKGRYYLNIRVPKDLRPLYGKRDIIRKSLDTSDYREAVSLVRFEAFKLDAEFSAKRREIAAAKRASQPPPELSEVSDREAHEIVTGFFVGLEKLSHEWWEDDGRNLTDDELTESIDNLRIQQAAFSGGTRNIGGEDGSRALDLFIQKEGLNIPKDSAAYRKLRPLFRLAMLENTERTLDRADSRTVTPREPLFRDTFAFTPTQPSRPRVTLGEMLTRFLKWLTEADRKRVTQRTYELPARLLREVLGERTALDSITKDDVEKLFGLLRRAPSNATKRYPGMSLEDAITAADKRGDDHRLSAKTLENYYNNIVAIFNFAVGKRLMSENPAKDRYSRQTFERKDDDKPKALFTTDKLNRLFRAPLYTGCRDDDNGYATPGPNHPRRGRFWLPLLSLFHGFRANEVAQLYTEDVCEAEGVPYFEIREERADGSKCDKRLKTKQSKRRVPIHPETLRIGFLDYVAERRRDTSHPRLFPDLPCGATGYFSDPFSKWFGRFLKSALGKESGATFHAFRHAFRDALSEAGVPIPDVEALGGWELIQRSAERGYGKGPSLRRLRDQIELVKFPDLDLAHLHVAAVQPAAPHTECRVRRRRGAKG